MYDIIITNDTITWFTTFVSEYGLFRYKDTKIININYILK